MKTILKNAVKYTVLLAYALIVMAFVGYCLCGWYQEFYKMPTHLKMIYLAVAFLAAPAGFGLSSMLDKILGLKGAE